MRWRESRRSTNVEDRRGQAGPGSGVRRRGLVGGGLGLLLVIGFVALGGDPRTALQLLGSVQSSPSAGTAQPSQASGAAPAGPRPDDPLADFSAAVLGNTEDTWSAIFQKMGKRYEPPTLVLFTDSVRSACGLSSSATGPFYCPGDHKLYIDLGFFRELRDRFGAKGDFAQAYVIAHEVGHHVQNLLGISERVHAAEQRASSKAEANALSVRLELQADCFAGVWAHHANADRHLLEPGDVQEALTAAEAIGDDTLQRQAGGVVRPESFTHGTSAQRERWLKTGIDRGTIDACDTFATDQR